MKATLFGANGRRLDVSVQILLTICRAVGRRGKLDNDRTGDFEGSVFGRTSVRKPNRIRTFGRCLGKNKKNIYRPYSTSHEDKPEAVKSFTQTCEENDS